MRQTDLQQVVLVLLEQLLTTIINLQHDDNKLF